MTGQYSEITGKMEDFTIISYPGPKDSSLLSLTEDRSRYMLPLGGRFRVVDFTIYNSFSSGARHTLIYSNIEDSLDQYIDNFGPFDKDKFSPIKVISKNFSDIKACYDLILGSNTKNYLIYNGDTPGIIDFKNIAKRFKAKKAKATLFLLKSGGAATMSCKVLAIQQKPLLQIVNSAIDQARTSPNIFEMVINIMINKGVPRSSFSARYWPLKNIPDYFNLNREMIRDHEITDLLFNKKIIPSHIRGEGFAYLGEQSRISNSFISDHCSINGTVENSILYPGVTIGSGSIIKNSIILPFVKIGDGSKVVKAIVDERTETGPEQTYTNIGNSCIIGSDDELVRNSNYPKYLFESITLIGKNTRIPDGTRIGAACYVGNGMASVKALHDGESQES